MEVTVKLTMENSSKSTTETVESSGTWGEQQHNNQTGGEDPIILELDEAV